MIHVIAVITARPGLRATLLGQFAGIVPLVLAEKGCLQYEPVIDLTDPVPGQVPAGADTFIVVERWESADDLRAHGVAPHMLEYRARVAELVQSVAVHAMIPALGAD